MLNANPLTANAAVNATVAAHVQRLAAIDTEISALVGESLEIDRQLALLQGLRYVEPVAVDVKIAAVYTIDPPIYGSAFTFPTRCRQAQATA